MIQETRIKYLNNKDLAKGKYVIYWMQQSQRVHYNHALVYAIEKANELGLPLVVIFCITSFPEANLRHYSFMLEGIHEVAKTLKSLCIKMITLHKDPILAITEISKNAALVVTDCGYLKIQRIWRKEISLKINVPFVQIETDVIVPVEVAYKKEAYSAGVFRPKLHQALDQYLQSIELPEVKIKSLNIALPINANHEASESAQIILDLLRVDKTIKPVSWINGGESYAQNMLKDFIHNKLEYYSEKRNDPSLDYTSHMSAFLHFGQISPLYIALQVLKSDVKMKDSYLEELIVRRELSMNFVYYNNNYDSFNSLPGWSKKSLIENQVFTRDYIYTQDQFEKAKTHDKYWNAAQTELIKLGRMHGYMRMYWGKKIIEWTSSVEQAYKLAIYLNNKYALDGRDANSYTGIAWCFGKHDRPWKERKIFGKVRYMNEQGLKRKFKIEDYVDQINKLKE